MTTHSSENDSTTLNKPYLTTNTTNSLNHNQLPWDTTLPLTHYISISLYRSTLQLLLSLTSGPTLTAYHWTKHR